MTDNERMENARAAEEARDTAISRSSARGSRAGEDAMTRYLASESFHERRREEQELKDAALEDDADERPPAE